MVLYGLIVLFFAGMALGINGICAVTVGLDFAWGAIWSAAGLGIILGTDIVVVCSMRLLPKRLYNPFAKFYQTRPWQTNVCLALGVRRWKDKVPELGKLGGFRKDHLDNLNPDYLYHFLQEAAFGEAEHWVSVLMSWTIFLIPMPYRLTVGLPYCVLNIILNTMSAMIQRYLRPKMIAVYRRQKMKHDRQAANQPA